MPLKIETDDLPEMVDCHQHLWQLSRGDYGWLTPELGPIFEDFMPKDLAHILADHNIKNTILVQAAPTLAESQFLLTLAEKTPFIKGVVGWIDMDNKEALAQLNLLAKSPYLKSIRPMIQDIADPDWILDTTLSPIFEALIEQDIAFDALVLPQHLSNLVTLAQRHPTLRMVINHGAKPNIEADCLQDKQSSWASDMARLGSFDQVYCKLSGLLTEAGARTSAAQITPYMQTLLDHFGPEKLMFGSDWPVLTLAESYHNWFSMVTDFLDQQVESKQHQAQIMGGTAAKFYQIEGFAIDPLSSALPTGHQAL